ncbi:unnamed protein product [Calypogeia fissa]
MGLVIELPLISFLMLQFAVTLGQQTREQTLFQFDRDSFLKNISQDRGLTLQVPNDPFANISEIHRDDMTADGGFQLNGSMSSNPAAAGRWGYKTPVQLGSFGTMFDLQLEFEDQLYYQMGNQAVFAFIISNQLRIGNDIYVGIETFLGEDSLVIADLKMEVMGYNVPAYARIDWLGDAMLMQNRTELTMWIEYSDTNRILDIFVTGTGATCGGNVQDAAPLLCKPLYPVMSYVDINLTSAIPQDGNMSVGFWVGNVINDCRINGWTFNSEGPAPDFGRDFNGVLIDPKQTKWERRVEFTRRGGIIIAPVVVFLILTFIICILYRRNTRLAALARKYDIDTCMLDRGPQNFKYKVLSAATKGFSSNSLLGSGGFGSVYRGKLVLKGDKKPTEVAVKRISATSRQGAQEFLSEVKIIGQAQHRNLVRLLGWCHQRGELSLVYEYMPNGSLDKLLYRKKDCHDHANGEATVLTWTRRLRIVSGIATALAFLHEEWEHRVIHRDVKSSNVMLDHDFNARLGDFGLARMYDHSQVAPSTAVLAGTFGYMAPELFQRLKVTDKTDVYSFGALVLEVATGKRPLLVEKGNKTYDDMFLVDWVWDLYRDDKLLDAADSRLRNAYDPGEMLTFLKLGLLCSHPDPNERPTMRDVINIWKGSSPFPPLPKSRPVPVYAIIPLTDENDTNTKVGPSAYGVSGQPDESLGPAFTFDSNGHMVCTLSSTDDEDSVPQWQKSSSFPMFPGGFQ